MVKDNLLTLGEKYNLKHFAVSYYLCVKKKKLSEFSNILDYKILVDQVYKCIFNVSSKALNVSIYISKIKCKLKYLQIIVILSLPKQQMITFVQKPGVCGK